jgi:hypothetical protein
MYGAQIGDAERAQVLLSSNQTRMTKNTPQKLKVAAPLKVFTGKRVPERVRGKADAADIQLLPQYLEIPLKVPNGDLRIVIRAEQIESGDNISPLLPLKRESEKMLAQLRRKGYEPVFIPFPDDFKDQVVHIAVFFRKAKHLRGSKSRIKNRKSDEMSTEEISAALWAPLENRLKRGRRESG